MAGVHASYFTDPLCPWSWVMEPAFRVIDRESGGRITRTFVMAGPEREVSADPGRILECLDAGERGGMPVDPRLWAEGPPRSSFPARLALKAAAEPGLDGPYLRRARAEHSLTG